MTGKREIKILSNSVEPSLARTIKETFNYLKDNSLNGTITVTSDILKDVAEKIKCTEGTVYCSITVLKRLGAVSILSREIKRTRTKHKNLSTNDKAYNYFAVAKSKYGIDRELLEKIWKEQGEKCPICGKMVEPSGKRFHIDHNHETGIIRGLLCSKCNMGIGIFDEDISRLKSAITYLTGS
jgi:hypothetical protein